MDSYGQQAYQAMQGHRTKRSHVGEVLAALLLLLSIFLLLVTGTQAMQFRSIIKQGKASAAVEYHTEESDLPENTSAGAEGAVPLGDNKANGD